MISVNPYIFFKGNAGEAMEFYQSIFGGKLDKVPYGQMGYDAPKGLEGKLMHAYLDGEVTLMASDTVEASDVAKKVSISISGDDEVKLTEWFNRLSEDVEVIYPLKKEGWGDIFGSVIDKHGVEWMINISQAQN